jgi:hypothetical protein
MLSSTKALLERDRARRQLSNERFAAAVEAKEKLNTAFALLRKQGLIAKQRFSCCRGCAGCRLANNITKSLDKGGKRPRGAVFYTTQEGFFDEPRGRHPRPQKLYLSFGDVNTAKYGDVGEPTVKVGERICKALDAVGLHWEWDGTENTTILVDPCPGLWNEEPRTRFERVA